MLNNINIILGSHSPRRKQLLESIIPSFDVMVKSVDEDIPDDVKTPLAAQYLAKKKAAAFDDEVNGGKTVITADTVVIWNNTILAKPENKEEAIAMLTSLSGDTHQVRTGVCIRHGEKEFAFDDVTEVTFRELTAAEIRFYVNTYSPLDKAGAYGIQEWIGMIGITKIEGCFYNVMGFPTHKVYEVLQQL